MKKGSIVSRVVVASLLAALISALVLAAAAAFTAWLLWRDSEVRNLRETASSLATYIRHEAEEGHVDAGGAAAEAMEELPAHGYRLEVWRGNTLIAHNMASTPLGPFTTGARRGIEEDWLLQTVLSPDGLLVSAAEPREQRSRSLRVFYRSLLLAAPLCAAAALLVGTYFGRRAIRPLVAFTKQIAAVDHLSSPPTFGVPDAPLEVRELERSFRDLLARLSRSLEREIEFAGNASHELRTPLTRIRLHAERALGDAGPIAASELRKQLAEVDQLVRLVDSLLVLARDVESGGPIAGEPVNLADLARASHRCGADSTGSSTLEAPDEAMVRGDEDLLGIAIENLFDNARKYSPDGYAASMAAGDGLVQFTILSRGVLADAGPDVDERLFQRFFREESARAEHPGHGLGLSLGRHIARLHGGDLRCEPRPPAALAFVLTLPSGRPRDGETAG